MTQWEVVPDFPVPDDKVEKTYQYRYYVEYKTGGKRGTDNDVFYSNSLFESGEYLGGRRLIQVKDARGRDAVGEADYFYFADEVITMTRAKGSWTEQEVDDERFEDDE